MPTDIRTLDLNLLRAFDVLLDECSVTRAAARLSLTQPAVSGILLRLRESFDDALFVRARRGIVPTVRALELAEPVRQILADVGKLLQPAVFDAATSTMTMTIASTDYALRAVVVPFLSALRPLAPGIRVAVVPVDHAVLQEQLERGDIDLALLTPSTTPADLHTRTLFDERYVCAMRSGHPAAAASLTLKRFCTLDHALVSLAGAQFHGVTDEALAALGKRRRVTVSVPSFLMLPELLRMSDLIAVAPQRLVKGVAGLRLVAPPLAIPGFTKVAAWHQRTDGDAGFAWLRELLFRTCRALQTKAQVSDMVEAL